MILQTAGGFTRRLRYLDNCLKGDPSLTPEKAVDGDEDTRWASGRDDNQWYIVDLEERCTITGFGILWEGAHGKEYKIQVSENGTDWTDVIHETNGSAGWKNYTLSNPAAGRYVRMLGIKRGNAKYGYSMYEFQVFGYQPQNPKPVTSIRLSQNTLSLLEGWSCALTATTQPSSNVYSLKWTSSDPAIVKVDNNGLVTAIGSSGTAMITVESVLDPTVKDTCEVTITPYAGRPTKVSNVKIVNEPTGLLKKGQDWSLAANVLPAGASNRNVNWSSSDPTVAAIDANGVVHAVSAGRAVIRATSVSAPAIFAEITVEVGHTVRFESAETVQIEEQLVADGAYAVKPEDPTRAGYRFEGWYRDTEASEAFDFTQPIHADTVIYLKWTSLPQDVPAVPAENPSMDLGLILGIINGGSGMSFSDVTSSDWFFEDIAAAYQLGLMNGVSTYEFAPKAPLSRAMVAAMLYRMAGSPAAYYGGRQFTDGADGKWYSSVIRWASPGILRFPPSAARRRRKASGRPRFSSPPRRPMTSSTSPACRGSTLPAARTSGILTRTTPSPASPGANMSGRAAARRWAFPSRSTTALSTACISAGSMKPCSKKSTIWSNQTNP